MTQIILLSFQLMLYRSNERKKKEEGTVMIRIEQRRSNLGVEVPDEVEISLDKNGRRV